MGAAIRLVLVYLVTTTVGVGWSIVMAFNDLRNKPEPGDPTLPAPLWVNGLFMGGLSLILVGLGWFQVTHLELALQWSSITTFVGMVLLNAGAWGLLVTTARKGKKRG